MEKLTLLQTLLIETLPEDTDPILRSYIETILPAMERQFSVITALGGSYKSHLNKLEKQGDHHAEEKAQRWSNRADQGLQVHVLNALLTAWNLSQYLPDDLQLSEEEKRLLCLGITLHDYNKIIQGQTEASPSPKPMKFGKFCKSVKPGEKNLILMGFGIPGVSI